ncbi:MAG: hypothetical protein PVF05_02350 [Gemmatimonadales bacterium]
MARRDSPVPDWIPGDLPAAPGVYRFLDAAGTPIYIGKSVNLKRRVRGYFYGGGPGDERKREMLRLARGLGYRRCGSDLEAQLEEADGISTLRPAFNRVHKNRSRGWYIEVDWSRPFPRLRVVREPRRARAEYIGPYRGRRIPAEAVALVEKIYRLRTCAGAIRPNPDGSPCLQYGIDQCSAPCVGLVDVDAYRAQVRHALAALLDGREAERHARILEQRLAAAEHAVNSGGRGDARSDETGDPRATSGPTSSTALHGLRRRQRWFEELESYRPALHRLPVDRSRLIVLPAARAEAWVLVPVARGRVLPRVEVDASGDDWREQVADTCYQLRVEELRSEAAFPVEALTLTLIVGRWLRSGRQQRDGAARVFDLDRRDATYVIDRLCMTAGAATG